VIAAHVFAARLTNKHGGRSATVHAYCVCGAACVHLQAGAPAPAPVQPRPGGRGTRGARPAVLCGNALCERASGRDLAAPAAEQVAEAPGRTASTEKARVAVLGASGYTGEEVVRLLALHPVFDVTVLTGETQAGKVCRIVCRSHSHQSVVCAGDCSAGLPRTA